MIALLMLACSSGTTLTHQAFEVGCGMCMFNKPSTGCYWAAKVDDQILGVGGPGVPSEEQLPSHGPAGMCTMTRTAYITGTLYEDKIIADVFELEPVGGELPTAVHDHKH